VGLLLLLPHEELCLFHLPCLEHLLLLHLEGPHHQLHPLPHQWPECLPPLHPWEEVAFHPLLLFPVGVVVEELFWIKST